MFQSLLRNSVRKQYIIPVSFLYIHLVVSESMQSAIKSGNRPLCSVNIKKSRQKQITHWPKNKTKTKQQQKQQKTAVHVSYTLVI